MNIIVTGASRGIGYELVKQFVNAGHKVIAIARTMEKLERLKKECEGLSGVVQPVICDLNNEAELDKLPGKITEYSSSVDILVNNAGAIINKPFTEISKEDLLYVYNVNVFAIVGLIQKVLPMMKDSQRGHVVNIGSMGGFQGSSKFAGLSGYSSSKAALACITECLAEEFKNSNIAFNCLALGAAQTEMLEEAFPGYKAPLSASEMAGFIANFALNSHHFMNGKVIPVSMSTP
ncbi:MAG: family oxidoreductase [Bacteroidota bacterium]|jgi:short-subunit dehydrogenase|nr:family oxidoreductase [Bacteroidota bacterium]